jgi:hypothetical protein
LSLKTGSVVCGKQLAGSKFSKEGAAFPVFMTAVMHSRQEDHISQSAMFLCLPKQMLLALFLLIPGWFEGMAQLAFVPDNWLGGVKQTLGSAVNVRLMGSACVPVKWF